MLYRNMHTNNIVVKVAKLILKSLAFVPLLLLVYLFFGSVFEAYKGFFLPRETYIDVALEDFDDIEVTMDWHACVDSSLGNGHFEYEVSNPVSQDYLIHSVSTPLTMTVGFQEGAVNIVGFASGITETILSDYDFTEIQGVTFQANQLEVNYDNPENLTLLGNVCTPKLILFGRFVSGGIHQSYFSTRQYRDYSRVNTIQSFNHPNEKVQIQIQEAVFDDSFYDELIIQYESNQNYRESELHIRSRGDGLRFDIPNGKAVSEDQESSFDVISAYVDDVKIINPSGQITLEYEGVTEFLPKLGGTAMQNELFLKHDSSYLIISGWRAGAVSIFGDVTEATYLGNRLNHSKWENVSPDVQAALIAALLGAIGFTIIQTGPKIYKSYIFAIDKYFPPLIETNEDNEEKTEEIISPPIGSLVIELNSGKKVAGLIIKAPTWLKKRYLLKNIFLSKPDGNWEKGPSSLTINVSQVSFSYLVEESRQ